jgi:hypothetical protein
MVQGERFEIVLTRSSILRYQDDVYPYLNSNFSPRRVFEIDVEIFESVESLQYQPHRCSREPMFIESSKALRFLLYRASDRFELKILFFIDELPKKVFVVDFFPTRMNPTRMKSN